MKLTETFSSQTFDGHFTEVNNTVRTIDFSKGDFIPVSTRDLV